MAAWVPDDTQNGRDTTRREAPPIGSGRATSPATFSATAAAVVGSMSGLDTLPQDRPWSRVGWCLVCKECGAAGSVNIVPNWHDMKGHVVPFTRAWKS